MKHSLPPSSKAIRSAIRPLWPFVAVLFLGLSACYDGVPANMLGSGADINATANGSLLSGIWNGAFSTSVGVPGQFDSTFTGLLDNVDHRITFLESNGNIWDGPMSSDGGTVTPSIVTVYKCVAAGCVADLAANQPLATDLGTQNSYGIVDTSLGGTVYSINGALDGAGNTLTLNYSLGPGVGLIQMQFLRNSAYTQSTSTAQLSGNWSRNVQGEPGLTLAINGVNAPLDINGQDAKGCSYQGTIAPVDSSHNLFVLDTLELSESVAGACDRIIPTHEPDPNGGRIPILVPKPYSFVGVYSGLAAFVPNGNTLLIIATNGGTRALSLSLSRS